MLSKKIRRNIAAFNHEKAKKPLYSAKRIALTQPDNSVELYLQAYKEAHNDK